MHGRRETVRSALGGEFGPVFDGVRMAFIVLAVAVGDAGGGVGLGVRGRGMRGGMGGHGHDFVGMAVFDVGHGVALDAAGRVMDRGLGHGERRGRVSRGASEVRLGAGDSNAGDSLGDGVPSDCPELVSRRVGILVRASGDRHSRRTGVGPCAYVARLSPYH